MAEKGIAWTPTIMAYTLLYDICKENLEKNAGKPVNDPVMQKEMKDYQYFEPAYKAYRDHFKEFYDTGVTVIAGTDMVMYQSPFLPLPRELQYMVEYGITGVQLLQQYQIALMHPNLYPKSYNEIRSANKIYC